jgi:hypothetical protein
MREQAVTKYPDCDPDAIFEQFAAYHGSKGTLMVDWRCAWITWLSNAGKFGYPKKKSLRWM